MEQLVKGCEGQVLFSVLPVAGNDVARNRDRADEHLVSTLDYQQNFMVLMMGEFIQPSLLATESICIKVEKGF